MPITLEKIYPFIVPFVFIILSIILGIIFEKIILVKLKNITGKTEWKGDNIIVDTFIGKSKIIIILAGFYFAIQDLPVSLTAIDFLSKTIIISLLSIFTFIAAKITSGFIDLYHLKENSVDHVVSIFTTLAKILVFIIGFLLILQFLGISIAPILTALGVGGLAVALALQETLSNLFAGIQIIVSRQVKIGDFIKLDKDIEGHVYDISWRYTTIYTISNNHIVVPNSKIASSMVINFSLPNQDMALKTSVGVSYNSDLELVEKITKEVAEEIIKNFDSCSDDYKPIIRYHTFNDFSIDLTVIFRINDFAGKYMIRHEFIKRLHERYNKEGIEIPFPIRTIHISDNRENRNGNN